jgi:capsular exopolysaccharide synthesis family protein
LITSAGPGDGKSSIASGLGISIAKQGKPTILLDADLRRPSLHRKFDLGEGLGFTDLLLGKAAPSDVMVPIGDTSLFVIRSGPIPPDPPTLFRSSRLREVLEDLEKVAELVIIDSPPLLAVTDPMLLADVADAAVLVVDMRNTRRAALRHASDLLHRGGVDVLGTILNKSKSRSSNYYAYGYGAESDGSTGLAARPWRTLKRLARRR